MCYLCKDCYKPWSPNLLFVFRLSVLQAVQRQPGPVNRAEEIERLTRVL
jgi:hypothetical protein